MYSIGRLQFKTEIEAIRKWLGMADRKFYTIYKTNKYGNKIELKCKEIDVDKLEELYYSFNDRTVYYKNSKNGYMYKNFDKVNLKDLDYIVLLEKRGIQGNIVGALRINKIADKYVAII